MSFKKKGLKGEGEGEKINSSLKSSGSVKGKNSIKCHCFENNYVPSYLLLYAGQSVSTE